MRNIHPRELQFYQTPNGREPFTEWFESIQNKETQDRIQKRLDRIALGNFGDYRTVGGGFLNFVSILEQAIVFIFEKWVTQLYFCFAVVINRRKHGILNVQKTIG